MYLLLGRGGGSSVCMMDIPVVFFFWFSTCRYSICFSLDLFYGYRYFCVTICTILYLLQLNSRGSVCCFNKIIVLYVLLLQLRSKESKPLVQVPIKLYHIRVRVRMVRYASKTLGYFYTLF
jgi:hypothetical protein